MFQKNSETAKCGKNCEFRFRHRSLHWLEFRKFSSLAFVIFLLCFSALHTSKVQAQTQTQDIALKFVETVYTTHQSLLGIGLGGVWGNPDLQNTLFAPQVADVGSKIAGKFDILTGSPPARIEKFQLRLAADQPPPEQGVKVEVAVRAGGPAKFVSLTVAFVEGDLQQISDLAGKDWTLQQVAAEHGSENGNLTAQNDSEDLFGEAGGEDAASASNQPSPGNQTSSNENSSATQSNVAGSLPTVAVFEDGFDGNALNSKWQLINGDPNSYLVENGELLAIATGGTASFDNPESPNFLKLGEFAGSGDFTMSLSGRLDPKTGYETVWLGLHEGEDNFVAVSLRILTKGCGSSIYLDLVNERSVDAEEKPIRTYFVKDLFDGEILDNICDNSQRLQGDMILRTLIDRGFELTLTRKGFLYSGTITLDVPRLDENTPGGPVTIATKSVSRTKPFGVPAFLLGQLRRAGKGETIAQFDRFAIQPN